MPLTPMVLPNGKNVQECREGMAMSRADLARRIRRTRQAIWKVETGMPVSEALMRQVARALKVDMAALVLPDENRPAA